jgi:DNA-binding beta-propeller fold protein YncE
LVWGSADLHTGSPIAGNAADRDRAAEPGSTKGPEIVGARTDITAKRRGVRHAWRGLRGLLALILAGGMHLVCSPPVSALLDRGHVFSGTFEGIGAQGFGTPSGIAVNEASGEVYVADPAHERVERFRPTPRGYEFAGELKVASVAAIAIDNSSDKADPSRGDVYVAAAGGGEEKEAGERNYLYKFTASGEKIFKKRFFKAKENGEEFDAELERISGVAVDATGKLWLYWGEGGNVSGFSDDEQNKLLPSLTKEGVLEQTLLESACLPTPGFAVGPSDEVFYVAHGRETGFGECPEEEVPMPTLVSQLAGSGMAAVRSLNDQNATGVALDPSDGDVYVDNASSVAAFGSEGTFIQRFGSGDLSEGGALALDSRRGIIYVAEPGKIAVFTPEGAGAPTVNGVSAQNLTPSSERVNAQIDPDGANTTYMVQYGTVSCLGPGSACTETREQEVGEGFGDVSVHTTLEGLRPDTTYYYRVIAKNEHGIVASAQSVQTFFTTLPSSEGVLFDHRQWQLVSPTAMHGATPEPIDIPELGSLIQASTDGESLAWTASGPISGEAEGNRQPEPVQVISTRGSEEWSAKEIGTPHTKGEGVGTNEGTEYRFFSPDLSLAVVQSQALLEPLENPPLAPGAREKTIYRRSNENGQFEPLVTAGNDVTGTPFGGKLEFQGATADVEHVVFTSEVPLVAGALGRGLYEWEAGVPLKLLSVLPGGEHTPATEPDLGYNGFDVRGAISQGGSRFFWTNEIGLGPLYMRNTAKEETVQINAAQGVREAGEEERADALDEVHFQAASSDGSRVFFTDTWPLTGESSLEPNATEEEPHSADLYEYNVEDGKLTDLTVTRNAGELAEVLGTLPGASEDGSYVYFVANGVLATGAERGNCPRESSVRNPAASRQGDCNLYVSEPDPEHPGQRETRFIARLSEEDANDWGGGNSPEVGDLGGVTSQVSSNGRYLAFMSDRELTGYDNVDANPGAKGAHDEEVFLYDANTGRLVCASCNPAGQAPNGVFDTKDAGEGEGLTVDRPELWSEQWLAGSIPGWTLYGGNLLTEHQSRYLSNNGRLFFDGADALVARVQARTRQETVDGKTLNVGVENVYEYEPSAIGSCQQISGCVALISSGTSERESAFLDASEGGGVAFFLTAAKLVAQDTEPGYEVYAAAECGTSETPACLPSKLPPPEECTGEACRGPAGAPPGVETPPTYTSSFPGNNPPPPSGVPTKKSTTPPKLTRAQDLAKALKACHALKRDKQRRTCERAARRVYRARAKSTNRKAAGRGASLKGRGK